MSEAIINEKFLVENYNKMSVTELAKYFGVSRGTICRRSKKFGLEKEETFYILENEKSVKLDHPLDNYCITNLGRVYNLNTGKLLKDKVSNGYPTITFCVDKKFIYKRVHRLIAENFIKNEQNKPFINHIDGNKENYSINNLEWVTPKENSEHASRTGLLRKGEDVVTSKITENQAIIIKNKIKNGERTCDIVRELDYATRSIVQKIKYQKTWRHL